MPHTIVEYSANIRTEADIPGLLAKLAAKLRDSGGVFPLGGIRVRAYCASDYVIADGAADDAFVHATVKIAPGRPEEFRRRFFGEVFAIMETHFAGMMARRGLALSLYVEEVDEAGSYKRNTIHHRFGKAPASAARGG